MAIKKFVVGCFDEEGALFDAVKRVRKAGYKLHDVYTPFPIHGLDKAMGLRDTSIHTAGFIYAVFGTATALSFMTWVFTNDWPLNIGGKPILPYRPGFLLRLNLPYCVHAWGWYLLFVISARWHHL